MLAKKNTTNIVVSNTPNENIIRERANVCSVVEAARVLSLLFASRRTPNQPSLWLRLYAASVLTTIFFCFVFSVAASLSKTILSVCIYIEEERERRRDNTDESNKVRMHVNSVG